MPNPVVLSLGAASAALAVGSSALSPAKEPPAPKAKEESAAKAKAEPLSIDAPSPKKQLQPRLKKASFPATDGVSGASSVAVSSPGVAQLSTTGEGDSAGASTGAGMAGRSAPSPLSRNTPSTASDVGKKIWLATGGDRVLNRTNEPPNPQTASVLANLKCMLNTWQDWGIENGENQAVPLRTAKTAAGCSPNSLTFSSLSNSPSRVPNAAEAAVEALATAKRAEASRLVVERMAEERSTAERIFNDRQGEEDDAANDRLSAAAKRLAAAEENERTMVDRLRLSQEREVSFEQQVAAEQSRVCLLRADLEAARRELEARESGGHVKLAEELKAREVHIAAKTQCLESMHEDAQCEVQKLKLQHHVVEVDLGRSRKELETTNARQKVLEEELRLLKERPPKAAKTATQRRAAGGKLLDRFNLASRTSYEGKDVAEPQAENTDGESKSNSSWSMFGCCTTTKGGPPSTVSAQAPTKPY